MIYAPPAVVALGLVCVLGCFYFASVCIFGWWGGGWWRRGRKVGGGVELEKFPLSDRVRVCACSDGNAWGVVGGGVTIA